jgi:hypothetical protein
VELDAQKLIHQAGSPSLAKQAVDQAAEREEVPDFRQDLFAQRWGFASRKDLLAVSKPINGQDGRSWWATQIAESKWITWSDDDMSAEEKYPSLAAARAAIDRAHTDEASPSAKST